MEKKKSIINIREILITLFIVLAFIVVGSIKDIDITTKLFKPDAPSVFVILFVAIGEYPAYLGLILSGTLLMLMFKNINKWFRWLCLIVSIIFIGFSLYRTIHNSFNLSDYLKDSSRLLLLEILFSVLGVLTSVIVFLLTWRIAKNKSIREMFTVAFFVGMLCGSQFAANTVLKYLFSRPRPMYLYSINKFEAGFKNWWQLNPLAAFEGGSDYKSCPSGHASSSITLAFVLPAFTLLTEKHKNDQKLQIALYYTGFVFALLVGFSRIYSGAHYTSDVGMGYLVTVIIGWVFNNFLNRKFEERAILEKE